jgi:LPXTG-motif cell wall-anchored protein
MIDNAPVILVTDENGVAVSPNLPCGSYYIKEIKAPLGFVLPKEAILVEVVSDVVSEATVVNVGNDRGIVLPATGGLGVYFAIFAGAIIVILSSTFIITKRRLAKY